MDRFLILIFTLAGVTLIATEIGGVAFAEDKVRFSVAAITGSYMDEFVAIEKGYHREEGLSVEMIRAGGGIATQALIAGDLHFSTSAGSALTAMLRGAEIKVVYTNIDRPGYQLWSGQAEIKSLKDLIGKKVGVDTEKEIRFAYVGLAVSSRLLARQVNLVERFLRAVIKGREYARRYREQTVPILGKYTQRKREFNEVDYDSTRPVLTPEGWVGDEVLKEDVAMRAELVGLPAPADYGKFFDYSIAKRIYRELKSTGWKPTP